MKTAIYTLVLCVLVLMGCKKKDPLADKTPQASFNIPAKATLGEEIVFENSSTDATSYKWDFGDGASTSDKSPTHSFLELGTYNVNLTATNDHNGRTSIETKRITITKRVFTKLKIHKLPLENIKDKEGKLYAYMFNYHTGEDLTDTEYKTLINPTEADFPLYLDFKPELFEQNITYHLKLIYFGENQDYTFLQPHFNPSGLTSLHFYSDDSKVHVEIVSRPE